MILRTLTLAAMIFLSAAVAIAAVVLAAVVLEAVVSWLQSLEGWQRGAIAAAGLACVMAVVIEAKGQEQ